MKKIVLLTSAVVCINQEIVAEKLTINLGLTNRLIKKFSAMQKQSYR